MTEYAPSTKELKNIYILWNVSRDRKAISAEFDRWLNRVQAEARLEGVMQAYEHTQTDEHPGFSRSDAEGYEACRELIYECWKDAGGQASVVDTSQGAKDQ